MIDRIKKVLQEATDLIKDQASNIGENTREKTNQLIEDWLKIFPKLKEYGLEITSFSLGVAISPSLEVELKGDHSNFTPERLKQLIEENRSNTAILSVFNTIKTTYNLHKSINAEIREPLIVKVRIKLSPEIKVFIGEPIIQ